MYVCLSLPFPPLVRGDFRTEDFEAKLTSSYRPFKRPRNSSKGTSRSSRPRWIRCNGNDERWDCINTIHSANSFSATGVLLCSFLSPSPCLLPVSLSCLLDGMLRGFQTALNVDCYPTGVLL